MASNQSKLSNLIYLIQKFNPNELRQYIYNRSAYLNEVMYFSEYTSINDGQPLPWEIEIIAMCHLMAKSRVSRKRREYSISSIEGRSLLRKLRIAIKNSQDDITNDNILIALRKMMIQQSEYQKEINNLLYRYSFLYNYKGYDPKGDIIDISSSFKKKFGYSYDEHEIFIFMSNILLVLYKKENIEDVFQKLFKFNETITSNISESISQINEYQIKELKKVNYDWTYVFKTINVFPVIRKGKGQYELILPHRLIYSLTDGFVNKFTWHDKRNRRNLGYAIQNYLYELVKSSKYFDFSFPDQEINNSPDVICVKDDYLICFESKLHVFKNAERSLNSAGIDFDYLEFISQIEKSYDSAVKIITQKTKTNIEKENTYFILCVLESSKINLKDIIDEYAIENCFFENDKDRLEYLYNHLVIVDFTVVELFFMYNKCSFIKDLIEMKSCLATRFDYFSPKNSDRKLLGIYIDIFGKKYDKLNSIIEESSYLFE